MNPLTGLSHMLSHPFMQHAYLAGTGIAALAGLVGYFVIVRGQMFAGDALSHVAYTGSLAALAIGVDLRLGLFVATIAVGLLLGLIESRGGSGASSLGADDITIGTTYAWVLGLGVFFLSYYTTHASTANGAANVSVLFGSIFGLSASAAWEALLIAVGLILLLVAIARPLLFSSLDPAVAQSRGIPTRLLGAVFLGIVGATAAETSQAVGAMLLIGLLGAPPAAARRITSRPWVGLALAAVLAIAAIWIGLALSYAFPRLPASFCIIAVATAEYALSAARSLLPDPTRSRPRLHDHGRSHAHS